MRRRLPRRCSARRNADPSRQSSFDGSLHEIGREESERDRHIDLSNAAFVASRNLIDTGDRPCHDLVEPAPTTGD
jgi:hypothetical protein